MAVTLSAEDRRLVNTAPRAGPRLDGRPRGEAGPGTRDTETGAPASVDCASHSITPVRRHPPRGRVEAFFEAGRTVSQNAHLRLEWEADGTRARILDRDHAREVLSPS